MHSEHYFYGKKISRDEEQERIKQLLAPYKDLPATEELKKTVWEKLMLYKHKGLITIPFKVILCKDPQKRFADSIEVILDSKV